MTLTFTRKLFFCLFIFLSILTGSNAQQLKENFDDIQGTSDRGWAFINTSAPSGSESWYQGIPTNATPVAGPFNAYKGIPKGYVSVGSTSTTGYGHINNWLVSPNRTFRNGDVITFWTRTRATSTVKPDRLELRLSTNGRFSSVGSTPGGVGDFTKLLVSVNPSLTQTDYPQEWTKFTVTISGLPAPTSGRVAFRYFVPDGGPAGPNSDVIGIDEFEYTPYVCPGITLSPAAGALTGGVAGKSYSYSLTQTGALGDGNFAITAGALPPGLILSAGGNITGYPTATGTFNFTASASDASGCFGSTGYSITVVCPGSPITFNDARICLPSGMVLLTEGLPGGGTYSGTGVSNGEFDPSVGTQNITYDYTDPYGCAYNKTATYIVKDPGVVSVTPKTQTICSGSAITAIVPSGASGAVTWTRDNSTDVTGIASSGTGSISGSLTNTTNTPVTVTFNITSTADGCSTSTTATVTVNPLTIVCAGDITINNIINTCGAVATYTATATGSPAPVISYSFSGATTGSGNGTGSGATFNIGVTTVTLTNSTSCGNISCSFKVTVNDNQNPVITCPAPVTVSCAGDVPAADISKVTATDNCSGVVVSFVSDVISNKTCANKYTITRTYRAKDNAGNTATCTQLITVNDVTAPVITCPGNMTAATSGACTAVVNYNISATDNCAGNVTVTAVPASGFAFPIGTTTVNVTATDVCGNHSECSFTVTVTDSKLPVINTQPFNQAVCPQQNATFSITASDVRSYQWQIQEGSNWTNINGANNNTYTVHNVTEANNGSYYRVVLEGACKTITSESAKLSFSQAPQPTISMPAEICIEQRNIQLIASPAGGTFSGTGVTGNNWNLEIPAPGNQTISYTYTDANGCSASAGKVIKLGICNNNGSIPVFNGYPNPTRGKIILKALINTPGKYSLTATDLNGRSIWHKYIQLQSGWNSINFDLAAEKAGMYIITLRGGNNGKEKIKLLKIE